ncbi:hypothetical protein D3C83_59690 [compost metagenome]
MRISGDLPDRIGVSPPVWPSWQVYGTGLQQLIVGHFHRSRFAEHPAADDYLAAQHGGVMNQAL